MYHLSAQPDAALSEEASERVRLGARIRRFRQGRRLTLRALAAASDISPGFLSQVERGTANMSVGSLRRLAEALGVTLVDLFDPDTATGHRLVHAEERPELTMALGVRKYLVSQRPLQHVEVYQLEFEPGASTADSPYRHGDSQEIVVVIRGTMTAELGEEELTLRPGSSVDYRSSTPHRLTCGDEPAEVLWVISPPATPGDESPHHHHPSSEGDNR